jgi:hypothetical protein
MMIMVYPSRPVTEQVQNDSNVSALDRNPAPTVGGLRAGNKSLIRSESMRIPVLVTLMVILFCSLATGVHATWSITPRFYLEEQYDDNVFLTETNEKDDFITTISPGVNVKYETPTELIDLDYEFRRAYFNDFSNLDFSAHEGEVEARKDFGPRFSLGVRDNLIQSENPIEGRGATEFLQPSLRQGRRNRYIRNVVEPEATLTFGEDRFIQIGYRNQILRNEAEDIKDLDGNALNGFLSYRLSIHHRFEVSFEHFDVNYGETVPPSVDQDVVGDEARGRYFYDLDSRTSVFVDYQYFQRDFDIESAGYFDYHVHNPSVGLSRELLSSNYNLLILSVYGETGVDEDLISAESLGFSEFWRAGMSARYQLLERLSVTGFFFIDRDRYEDIDRSDTFWNARGDLNYQVLRWLFVILEYEHSERDSSVAGGSYEDNRYFGRIRGEYDLAEFF